MHARFLALHHADKPLLIANAWDAASTALWQHAGAPAIGTSSAALAWACGYADGAFEAAQFNSPFGIAIDAEDNLYIADAGNKTVRKITPEGFVSTLAGNPACARVRLRPT